MPSRFLTFALAVVLGVVVRADASDPPSPADLEYFESKVRPLLVERCYSCHSHDQKKDKGGLYVDSRQALLAGGDNGPAIVPGEPEKSKLIEAIGYKNVDLQMPPKRKLSDAEQATLTDWVKRGAPWPDSSGPATARAPSDFDIRRRKAEHWAWQPVKPAAPPTVSNTDWPKTPVDRFVLAKLEAKNLKPAPPADKRTLIRRASFAITGLPPTVEEVEAFVADDAGDAFEKVVDRLLASPHFGERWGRHWLDLVRYAETRGHEFDHSIENAWQYRDYVIRAFNADVPYDQFVIEHIAGDLLPQPRTSRDGEANESVLGTGFWFLGEWVHSPVDIRQDETDRVDNQIDVMGKTFLGLTIGCARCHDHKFDAISDEDYYAMTGFLHSSSYREVAFEHSDHNRRIAAQLCELERAAAVKLKHELATATIPVARRLGEYLQAAVRLLEDPKAKPPANLDPAVVAKWRAELLNAKTPAHPLHLLSNLARQKPAPSSAQIASVVAEASPSAEDGAITIVDYAHNWKDQWISDGLAFADRPLPPMTARVGASAEAPIAEVLDGITASSAAAGPQQSGMLRTPTFVISKPILNMLVRGSGSAFICIDSHRMVKGPLHGVSRQQVKSPENWQLKTANLANYIGHRAHIEFTPADGEVLSVRYAKLADAPISPPGLSDDLLQLCQQAESVDSLARTCGEALSAAWQAFVEAPGEPASAVSPASARLADWLAQRPALLGYQPARQPAVASIVNEHVSARRALSARYKPSATAMGMLDGSGFDERLLIRGSHKTPGQVVPRRFLEAFDGSASMQVEHGSGRLQLARKIAGAGNPLTSRVIVNRVWHHLFGRGIVASTDNFGVLGDVPTHPDLLDHLASEFVKDGWSIKRLIRRLMLSRTWQMSSRGGADADMIDPQNLLLHRANLRRLEGEVIRDQMLAISGRLDSAMFGPSVDVYLTDFMEGRGRPGKSGPMDGAGRRSIYTSIRRNFLPPMMLAFDMPQPFNTMGRRVVSNVPAQALILMNDPFVAEQAGLWAKRVLADPALTTPEQRIEQMYRMAYARPPTPTEAADAKAFVQQAEGAGWADLAHVLMNVKEFIYLP